MVSDGHVASVRDLRNATSGAGTQGLAIDLWISLYMRRYPVRSVLSLL